MTIEEKFDKIDDYCISFKGDCTDCLLNSADGSCRLDKHPIDTVYRFLEHKGIFFEPELGIEFKKADRKSILATAEKYVCNDRNDQYGSPEDSFKVIADLWTGYLGTAITAKDVAAMMVLFKMARVRTGAGKADNWIDAAGYCACGGEVEDKEINTK